MEVLERAWDTLGMVIGSVLRAFERGVTNVFGSANARLLKKLEPRVQAMNELESKFEQMTDAELQEQTLKFRKRLAAGETLEDLQVEAFAVCREGGRRFLDMRHYDVQLIGGMVLDSGTIAEMVTGEGKTLVATLPAYLNALEGKGVHVVTVNDYLARRDMEWMGPLYMGLGLTVGAIQSDMSVAERQHAYSCDITYGTNNEFGFDYLRDNMRPAARGDNRYPKSLQQSQGPLHYAIVDEVDNILIDEARTPLIISGPAYDNPRKYDDADRISRQLKKDVHFKVNEKDHTASLTDDGVREAEKLAGVETFYTAGNMEWPHLIDNSLKAHHLYKRDVNYVVKEGRVVIVDEFTGRLMEGRQWSDGLHQAVEAKEKVKIKEETQTLATITLQNFFKLYDKICGMTGTALTEANEFWKIYKMDVVAIPTNRPMQRLEYPDVIYRTEREKYAAVADEIEQIVKWDVLTDRKGEEEWGVIHKEDDESIEFQRREGKGRQRISKGEISEIQRKGRPILVGTVSIEKSERLSNLLNKRGVEHEVLNAKHHKREADIVAQAGRPAAVTIATNMAGRGTDIVLGGNAETLAWARLQDTYPTRLDVPREEWDSLVEEIEREEDMVKMGRQVKELGGLHVIATERHDARRIDLQLRGRCGRQGDPGSSRFFLSLEDDLMRIFAGEWVKRILEKLGMTEGERIESRMVTRRIEAAQKKREEYNFEIRKNLLEYDEVMDEQRKRVYRYRQQILDGANCRELILSMIQRQVDHHLDRFLARDYGVEAFAAWAGPKLGTQLEGKQFRGLDFTQAELEAKDEAERMAESTIFGKIDEALPEEESPSEWNWESLARFCNSQYGLNLKDRDLKKVGRDDLAEYLTEQSRASISKIDLSEGAVALEEDYGVRKGLEWVYNKFGIEVPLEEAKKLEEDPAELKRLIQHQAVVSYDERESEYPIMAAMYRYGSRGAGGSVRLDREALAQWAQQRFQCDITFDELKNKPRSEIHDELLKRSRRFQEQSAQMHETAKKKVAEIFGETTGVTAGVAADVTASTAPKAEGSLPYFTNWLKKELDYEIAVDDLSGLNHQQVEQRVAGAVDYHFHPEMRRMERSLLLDIVDSAWKDHLLQMDYLRSSVGQRGWGQLDPKVEYKREGMRTFEEMWTSIGERCTDLVFRMEQLDEDFVGSSWVETSAVKEDAPTSEQLAQEAQAQRQAADAQQGEQKIEPIRKRGGQVGRNDPCPCNSGKKYKNCCMRNRGAA